ncbi:MAG: ATP synthase F1 subunit delta, partial [Clostridia bacterium]
LSAISEAASENGSIFAALDAPQLSMDEKLAAIDKVFDGCHPYVINTLKLLAESRRCAAFGYMAKQYKKAYNKDHNISDVTAITAVPLSPASEKKLTEKLRKLLGSEIVLTKKVDPSILGGVVIRTEGLQIDGGVKRRLDEIKKEIVR